MKPLTETSTPRQADLREKIQRELEQTRQEFHQLLSEISEEDLDRPSLNPAWTIREVLYHMSLAPRNLPSDVRLIRRLKWVPKFPAGPFNRLNDYMTRRGARGLDKVVLGKTYDQAHSSTLQVLKSVKDEEWQLGADYPNWDPMLSGYVTLERLFYYITLHFKAHSREIKGALGDIENQSAVISNG